MSVLNRFFSKKGMDLSNDWHEESFSYTDNSYIASEDVARCFMRYNPSSKMGTLKINLRVNKATMPPSVDFVQIGTMPKAIKYNVSETLAGQSSGILLLDITAAGAVRLFNGTSNNISGGMNWFRAEIPIVLA